jgi:hypothetical protein
MPKLEENASEIFGSNDTRIADQTTAKLYLIHASESWS